MGIPEILDTKKIACGDWWFQEFGVRPTSVKKGEKPWVNKNGVFVSKSSDNMTIVTDSFSSTPVFFDLQKEIISNNLKYLTPENSTLEGLDKIAFWENLIYDYAFNYRTSMKNIIQIPGGSFFDYCFSTAKWSTKRWNFFNIRETPQSTSSVLKSLDERLSQICKKYWKSIGPDGFILLPLSGGLDSRLLAMYLALTGDSKRIKAVTFAFSKKSWEYLLAKRVCKELGIIQHCFYALPRDIYSSTSSDFWKYWRGGLSVIHGHLYSYLKLTENTNALLVTGFFADPIAGYAASQRREPVLPLEKQPFYVKLLSYSKELLLDDQIFAGIENDLKVLYTEWLGNCDSFEFNEYVYLSQRQPKTFALLLQTYREFCDIVMPFADPVLVNLFLACPFSLRKDKRIIRQLLELRNINLAKLRDLSSAIATDGIRAFISSEVQKWSSRIPLILCKITNDKIRLFNPFWTEDLVGAFRVECRKDILISLKTLYEKGVLSEFQFGILKSKPLKNYEVARTGSILSYLPTSYQG